MCLQLNNISTEIVENIYLLKIPFESVYTSVFFIVEENRITVYDTATYESDVEMYIMPELNRFAEKGIYAENLVVSHFHGDHSGGCKALLEKLPNLHFFAGNKEYFEQKGMNVLSVSDGMNITENLLLYTFPGHSDDCVAIFDKRTNTLLTADAFQGYGILRYGVYGNVEKWCESIIKAEKMGVDNLISSHEYFPVGQIALGNNNSKAYLEKCMDCFKSIAGYCSECMKNGNGNFDEAAKKFCEENRKSYHCFPSISGETFKAIWDIKKRFNKS